MYNKYIHFLRIYCYHFIRIYICLQIQLYYGSELLHHFFLMKNNINLDKLIIRLNEFNSYP